MKSQLDFDSRRARRKRLLEMFPEDSGYAEFHKDGHVYVKHWDNKYAIWVVGTYTEDSFARYKAYIDNQKLDKELTERIERD